MLELDILLEKFMSNHFDDLDERQVDVFERLLEFHDPILYAWLMGHEQPEDKELSQIIDAIRA